jgi:hypothetical protein
MVVLPRKRDLEFLVEDATPGVGDKFNLKKNYSRKKGGTMIKVKTFASPLKIFHAKKEIEELDAIVNKFIEDNNVQKIISVSDAPTSDDNGATIGLIRVLAYE